MLSTMCEEAHISGHKTNHSLEATAATQLFHSEISEKVIQDHSGHRSIEGLRQYERVSDEQRQKACRALANEKILPLCAKQYFTPRLLRIQYNTATDAKFFVTVSSCRINIYQGLAVVKDMPDSASRHSTHSSDGSDLH